MSNQNDANMEGARGIRVSAHPDPEKVWITPTIWNGKRYVAMKDGGERAFPADIGDMDLVIAKHVGRES